MFKITNIGLLGSDYTVADTNGKVLQTVQVVSSKEILDAALGEFNDNFQSIDDYLEKSIKCLSGYKNVEPYEILWWPTEEEELDLVEIIEYAIQNGYTKIILEHITAT